MCHFRITNNTSNFIQKDVTRYIPVCISGKQAFLFKKMDSTAAAGFVTSSSLDPYTRLLVKVGYMLYA